MKLRLLTSMAGANFVQNAGDIIELTNTDAIKRYIERGIAEPVEDAPVKEKATKKTPAKRKAVKG